MKHLKTAIAAIAVVAIGGLGFIYSGVYPMGADDPHIKPVYWALDTLRERSIAVRASGIEVPPLDDPDMLLAGGADYNDMCAGCHLKPGKKSSEMSAGLYPQPPNLSLGAEGHAGHEGGHGDVTTSAARQFWIIKHGIKASGMAAFGPTHDDARIWAMVAFLQKLPTLDAAQYQILTARAEGDMAGMEGMDHDDASSHAHEVKAEKDAHAGMGMPGMKADQHAMATDLSTPSGVMRAFQAAMKSGDAASVKRLLAPDLLVFEGGAAERSRDEYASHHLGADMAFLKSSSVDILKQSSGGNDQEAWLTTESRIRGKSSKGKPLDIASTETALLRKGSAGWQIVHLHWSSQDFKAAP
ncbi:nuclear transport factor 2 family protein [Stagnimonas aquatica]|uniref:nuclear transport factor 2 family protein n=1 Tax=Stagnimonas aquatica TaxID=2689987 RepID=UPI00131576E2|nr:nuclear transport factor 2 family protein [Stagnimonas aquatica]